MYRERESEREREREREIGIERQREVERGCLRETKLHLPEGHLVIGSIVRTRALVNPSRAL
jgi:hypothetical protein